MDLISSKAEAYAKQHTTALDNVLQEIEDFTLANHAHAQMLSGHVQGKVLEMISSMLRPGRILEIGTFTGFSALCLAKGLKEDGTLHTIELRNEDAATADQYFEKAAMKDRIHLHVGDAVEIIPALNEQWDLVFIDADKVNYIKYYELTLPMVKKGGWLLADNVLFHGEVLEEQIKGKNAKAIQAFNDHVNKDERVQQVMLTIRDGLLLVQKSKRMFKCFITVLSSVICLTLNAQRISVDEYIEQFKDIAISEMKRSGVPASITLAQGILESENGNSDLVKRSNNHFGIKCKSNWTGSSVSHDDDATGECFRAYTNAGESYRDHSDFLKNNKRYSSLFALDPADYAGWAKGLKKAGYATNPKYPQLLIRQIELYNLQQYTLLALGSMPASDVAVTDPSFGNVPKEFKEVLTNTLTVETSYDEIRMNDTRCIYARKGTSLLMIADKKNISLKKLLEYNDLEKDGLLEKDQYIFLHKKQKTGEKPFYDVSNGETLYDVAQKHGMQLKYLLEYNNLDPNTRLNANTRLSLQPGVATSSNIPVSTDNYAGLKSRIHLVAPKEGLFAIAKTYNVTVEQLKAWNKLVSDNLKVGQELIVGK